jgi:hypothetical protein
MRHQRHSRIRWLLAACVAFALFGDRAAGMQLETADLKGTVKDELGGAIAGAIVKLTADNQQPRSTTSDASGGYVFVNVPPGHYEVAVSRLGFAPVNRTIDIGPGSHAVIEVMMRVAINQRVDVVGSLEDFRRATGMSPAGLMLGPEHLGALPDDPDELLRVLRELSATSGRPDDVAVYIDGQPIAARLPPKSMIQSVRISTNSFASEFAEPSSGLVDIITKPAVSDYRGESQLIFNDSRLNARNAFEPRKAPSRTDAYAGYLGGPVVPGRWSFLGYGGRWTRDNRVVVNTSVVDPAQLVVRPFLQSVTTPNRVNSYSLRTDILAASRHLFSLEAGRSIESQHNAGLESGLDLPERGIDSNARDDTARLSVVSMFADDFSSEFRARAHRRVFHEAALTFAPAVLVLDAFNAGGNQDALRQDLTTEDASISEILSYTEDTETLRGGVQLDLLRQTEQRLTNQAGTFTFGALVDQAGNVIATPLQRYLRTLQRVPGYGPSSFSISQGAPLIDFNDWRLSSFIQDDVQQTGSLTRSMGLRWEVQQHAHLAFLNLAPRAGIAWAPHGSANHTLRVAGGVFYTRVPPEVTLDPLRYDGVNTVQLVVDRPAFFPTVPSRLDATVALPTIRLNQTVYAPLTAAATSSYEWQVTRAWWASVGYTYRRGYRLLRTLNVNAPDPATGSRPHPNSGPMLEFDSSGRSNTQELRFSLRRVLARVSLFGTYTLRSSRSDTDSLYTIAADSRSLQGEYGRAADDERHAAVFGSVLSLPHDWSFSSLLTAGSGRPFNITTGWDNNGDLLFVDRPAVATAGAPGVVNTSLGSFDVFPAPGTPVIARNAGQGPSQFVLNAGLAKTFRFGDSQRATRPYLILMANGENVTNRINYTDFNGVVTSPLFAKANRALSPLRLELAARLGF